MASPSGTSSGSSSLITPNSSSEENFQALLMDQRKRKRMISNRESARRSRMRKQKHLDDLLAQVLQLKEENQQIAARIRVTAQHYLTVEADNSILGAQVCELEQRFKSLNEILNVLNASSNHNTVGGFGDDSSSYYMNGSYVDKWLNPLNGNSANYLNLPVMATAGNNMFQ